MADFYSLLASQLSNQGTKSNIIRPLIYVMLMLLSASGVFAKLNIYILSYALFGLFLIVFVAFIYTYFFCLKKDPDLLRSERYNLEKTAIERTAVIGDSATRATINPADREFVIYDGRNNQIEE